MKSLFSAILLTLLLLNTVQAHAEDKTLLSFHPRPLPMSAQKRDQDKKKPAMMPMATDVIQSDWLSANRERPLTVSLQARR